MLSPLRVTGLRGVILLVAGIVLSYLASCSMVSFLEKIKKNI